MFAFARPLSSSGQVELQIDFEPPTKTNDSGLVAVKPEAI
ncbi:MAG: hypothetical protein ACI9LY_002058 [Arenicella sp.]|jgi:hypothetical protein